MRERRACVGRRLEGKLGRLPWIHGAEFLARKFRSVDALLHLLHALDDEGARKSKQPPAPERANNFWVEQPLR